MFELFAAQAICVGELISIESISTCDSSQEELLVFQTNNFHSQDKSEEELNPLISVNAWLHESSIV